MNARRNIQGKNDILSNFHPSQLTFVGNLFHSAEQAYQYEKAMFLGELDVARSIRDAKDLNILVGICHTNLKTLQN